MKARIALVVPNLEGGGGVTTVARFVRDVIQHDDRFDLQLVSLATAANDTCNLGLTRPSTWLHGVTTRHGYWDSIAFQHIGAAAGELEFQRYRPRKALARALANCDLVQMVCGSPAWANSVIELGKPVSLQVATRARIERRRRDAAAAGVKDLWRKCMTSVTDRLDDRALRHVDAIQVENPLMLAYARQLNLGRNVDIRYAPPGLDASYFYPIATEERLRNKYVLCVGRLNDPRKNPMLLLEAWLRLPAETRGRYSLLLAGSSPPPASFWRRAEEAGVRGRVRYMARPDSDKLRALYQQANAFVLPSDEEGLGMVVLEAMACGVPVVATRCGGPDGIISDGQDGHLVALDDGETMAARLNQLLVDDEHNIKLGRAARRTIEQCYAAPVAAAAFRSVWENLLEIRGSGTCVD